MTLLELLAEGDGQTINIWIIVGPIVAALITAGVTIWAKLRSKKNAHTVSIDGSGPVSVGDGSAAATGIAFVASGQSVVSIDSGTTLLAEKAVDLADRTMRMAEKLVALSARKLSRSKKSTRQP